MEYDGADFVGFQRQRGRRTIQGELERAIAEIVGRPVAVAGAGRTDAGVHAAGQVASFTTESRIAAEQWAGALNAHLPPTIAVLQTWEAPAGFHARFSATSRAYQYTIVNRPARPAIGRQYCWHLAAPIEVEPMQNASRCLVGEHDFTSFAGAGASAGPRGNVRRVLAAAWRREGERVVFDVTADAFLPRMVRNLVGTLAQVGRGTLEQGRLPEILAARQQSSAVRAAPANGLSLVLVNYGEVSSE